MKKKVDTARPELHPIAVKSPWHHVGVDFIGPLNPPSRRGNRYILTLMDYFTKFAWAKELPTKEAENVVGALKEVTFNAIYIPAQFYIFKSDYHTNLPLQIFFLMGIPAALTTDQGSEFRNQLNDSLMKKLGISHCLTSCYHPQANGLVERFNQTLIHALNKVISGNKDSWDEHIPEIVYAYNTAIQVGIYM